MSRCLKSVALISLILFALPAAFAEDVLKPEPVPFNPTAKNSWEFSGEVPDPAAESPIDLRALNEPQAGEHGFIRLSDDGNSFLRGDGQEIRFYGSHMAHGYQEGKEFDGWKLEDYQEHARWLARLGVNLVRCGINRAHTQDPSAEITDLPPALLDSIFKRVAAAKENGIYVMLSPVWLHGADDLGQRLGFDPGNQRDAQMWLFIHPEVQRVYKAWLRQLYTTRNPYTGLAIKDDPAVAILEFLNEDSLLFYTLNELDGEPRRLLEEAFADWARARHGSLEDTLKAWNSEDPADRRAIKKGRLPITNIWFMTREGAEQDNPARSRDTLEFLVQHQRAFYAEMKRFVREDLGCPQLLAGSNFRSADLTTLDDALRYTWQELDVIHNNSYFSSGGTSRSEGWRADAGDVLGLHSAVTHPLEIPVNKRQVTGKPFIVTETLWNFPHPFEAEGPLVVAVYQSLTGVDAALFAGPREKYWSQDPYMPWWEQPGLHPMRVFSAGRPSTLGQFPAAALIFRKGYLEPGITVVEEKRTEEDLLERRKPLISEEFAYDFIHFDEHHREIPAKTAVPQEAFLVGRVAVEYDADPAETQVADLEEFVRDDGTILSSTRQIVLDRANGLMTFDAPKAQGAVGFLERNGEIALSDVKLVCWNNHAALAVVSLDDKPLRESGQVLVQFGSRVLPTNWQEKAATWRDARVEAEDQPEQPGLEVLATGNLPWRVEHALHTEISVANPSLTTATVLDANGVPREDEVTVEPRDNGIWFAFPQDAVYVVLSAE